MLKELPLQPGLARSRIVPVELITGCPAQGGKEAKATLISGFIHDNAVAIVTILT
jgi:hypothetical protein